MRFIVSVEVEAPDIGQARVNVAAACVEANMEYSVVAAVISPRECPCRTLVVHGCPIHDPGSKVKKRRDRRYVRCHT